MLCGQFGRPTLLTMVSRLPGVAATPAPALTPLRCTLCRAARAELERRLDCARTRRARCGGCGARLSGRGGAGPRSRPPPGDVRALTCPPLPAAATHQGFSRMSWLATQLVTVTHAVLSNVSCSEGLAVYSSVQLVEATNGNKLDHAIIKRSQWFLTVKK